jgi:hypothetical protein
MQLVSHAREQPAVDGQVCCSYPLAGIHALLFVALTTAQAAEQATNEI